MFQGRHHLKMDQKGRFRLPAHLFKKGDFSEFMVTNSIYRSQRCLDVYSLEEWEKWTQRISQFSPLDPYVQDFQRFYMASAQPVQRDGQNRLLVPPVLREFGDLETQIVVIGMGNKFEIWSECQWTDIFKEIEIQYENILQSVNQLQEQKERE